MEILRNFSVFKGAQYIHDDLDDEEPFYEESLNVNEVVQVPFSWEEKPGVPLRMSNRRHGGGNLRLKDVCILANAEKKGAILLPLPKPPASLHEKSSLPAPTCANLYMKQKKQHKEIRTYLNKSTTLMCRDVDPHMIEGDPFKKAIEACRHSKLSSEYSMRMHNGNHKPLIEKVGTYNEHREMISPAYLNKSCSTPLICRGASPHVNIEGDPFMSAIHEACRHSSGYMRLQNDHNCKPAIIEKDAAYNAGHGKGGQPAFTDALAQKKPNSSGLLGCRSVQNYDSIVRINNP